MSIGDLEVYIYLAISLHLIKSGGLLYCQLEIGAESKSAIVIFNILWELVYSCKMWEDKNAFLIKLFTILTEIYSWFRYGSIAHI